MKQVTGCNKSCKDNEDGSTSAMLNAAEKVLDQKANGPAGKNLSILEAVHTGTLMKYSIKTVSFKCIILIEWSCIAINCFQIFCPMNSTNFPHTLYMHNFTLTMHFS